MSDLERLQDLAVSDRGFVFESTTGATFTVNSSGLVLLRGLVRGDGRQDLVEALHMSFVVNGSDLHRDVDEFAALLREHNIVSADFCIE